MGGPNVPSGGCKRHGEPHQLGDRGTSAELGWNVGLDLVERNPGMRAGRARVTSSRQPSDNRQFLESAGQSHRAFF